MQRLETKYQPGDVFQVNEKHGRQGWVGAFILATEIKSLGIKGVVACIESNDQQNRVHIRLKWEEIDYVGMAPLLPKEVAWPDMKNV